MSHFVFSFQRRFLPFFFHDCLVYVYLFLLHHPLGERILISVKASISRYASSFFTSDRDSLCQHRFCSRF